jgi:N-acetylneuraminate synthase
MAQVNIGGVNVGDGAPCYVIGEIGINHNGDLEIAKRLVDTVKLAGASAVKFQKRTPELCVPKDQWNKERETPWGTLRYIDYKRRIEFGTREYAALDRYCRGAGVQWFASCWDEKSVDFIERFEPPCYKIASACLTDLDLLRYTRKTQRPIVLSTGMSTLEQIDRAVDVLGTHDLVILHATSAYPAPAAELNLRLIPVLRERYGVPVGYSGHEPGLAPTLAAVALGACMIERHITLDRTLWGTDHAASVEPQGVMKLVRDIRNIEVALGDGIKRVSDAELQAAKKLRRVA